MLITSYQLACNFWKSVSFWLSLWFWCRDMLFMIGNHIVFNIFVSHAVSICFLFVLIVLLFRFVSQVFACYTILDLRANVLLCLKTMSWSNRSFEHLWNIDVMTACTHADIQILFFKVWKCAQCSVWCNYNLKLLSFLFYWFSAYLDYSAANSEINRFI